MILYGLFVAGLFSVYSIYNRLSVQPEVMIYAIWVVWSVSGAIFATDKGLYFTDLFTLIQIGVLIFVVAGVAALRGSMSEVMFSIFAGVLILLILSLYHGDIQQAGVDSRSRAAGIVGNANGFAYHLLFINYAALYFWRRRKALWWKVFLSIPVMLSMMGIVFSGSRNGLLGIVFFYLLFGIFALEKKLPRNPLKILVIAVVLLTLAFYALDFVMSSTLVGRRMLSTGGDSSSKTRLQLVLDGIKIILSNPIFGVGLNNFRAHTSIGLYSHSNYIEVAANTGAVGLFLYYSIYFMLWKRMDRIKKALRDTHLTFQIGVFKAAILTILVQSFQTVNIRSKITWIFLAGAVGYTWAKERQFLRHHPRRAEQSWPMPDETHD
jgi:O-antigen ligase